MMVFIKRALKLWLWQHHEKVEYLIPEIIWLTFSYEMLLLLQGLGRGKAEQFVRMERGSDLKTSDAPLMFADDELDPNSSSV